MLALSLGAMAAYTRWAEPVYESTSIVAIDTNLKAAGSAILLGETRALSAELGVLRNSVELAERVVTRLRAEDAFERASLSDSGGTAAAAAQPTVRQAALALLRTVSFRALSAEEMIEIKAESSAPQEAARIANVYAEEYQAMSREGSRSRIAAARQAIERQVARRGAELSELEDRWLVAAQQGRSSSSGLEAGQLAQEYAALRQAREEAKLDEIKEQAALSVLQRQLDAAEARLPAAVVGERDASGLEDQIAALNGYIAQLSVQAEEYYAVRPGLRGNEDQDPRLLEIVNRRGLLEERREVLSTQLADEVRGASARSEDGGQLAYVLGLRREVAEAESRLQQAQAQESALARRAAGYSAPINQIPIQALTRERLEHRRAQMEQWYTAAVDRLLDTEVAEMAELGYVSIVRDAVVPARPVRPNTTQNALLGLLLGLAAGVGTALLRESSDMRVTVPDDVHGQSFDVYGVVPVLTSAERGPASEATGGYSPRLVSLLNPWSAITEHYRLIRTRIEAAAEAAPMQVLLVTSAEQGEGKSVTAANLAVVLSGSKKRTLLIDADLRRPSAHVLFGAELGPGLGDMLAGEHAFHVDAAKTGIDNLSLITAGTASKPPSELLGSPGMASLLQTMRKHYDIVLIDSPPVMAAPDAVTMAPLCDAVLTVASSGRTDRRALQAAQDALRAVGVQRGGVVLTHFQERRLSGRYGSGYGGYGSGYGTGYGYGPDRRPLKTSA
jgi:tyrosine-protein kinase Etk/Wzc